MTNYYCYKLTKKSSYLCFEKNLNKRYDDIIIPHKSYEIKISNIIPKNLHYLLLKISTYFN